MRCQGRGAQTARILSDDADVFLPRYIDVIKLIVTCCMHMEKLNGTVLDINGTVSRLGSTCSGILGIYAISGYDAVSYT